MSNVVFNNFSAWDGIGLPPALPSYTSIMFYENRYWPVLKHSCFNKINEWSLVLLSQGIEPIWIEENGKGIYVLLIPPEDWEKALNMLKNYEEENSQWEPRKILLGDIQPKLNWAIVPWVLFVSFLWGVEESMGIDLAPIGAMNKEGLINGEIWRLITATTLHADIGHLVSNLTCGVLLLGLAMDRYGAGLGFAMALVGGILGNLLGWFVKDSSYIGLGASGVIMGALGALSAWPITFYNKTKGVHSRQMIIGIIAAIFLFIMFGVHPQTDVVNHLGGFIGGIASGILCGLLWPNWIIKPTERYLCLTICWVIIIGAWSVGIFLYR